MTLAGRREHCADHLTGDPGTRHTCLSNSEILLFRIVIFRLVDLIKEGLDDAVASKEEEILVYGVLVSKFLL